MNLTQLLYAKALADSGSFTQAAERCHVTQPTLSNGIAQLEQELEQRLFTRTTRSVTLTPFGEHILPFISRVLQAQEALVQEARSQTSSKKVVRIGTSPLLSHAWLSDLLEAFGQDSPETEIILHEQNMADLYRMLDERQLDLVFGVKDALKSSWGGLFLYREPLYFIPRGANQPDTDPEGRVSLDQIADETFVMVPNICGLARATRALFRSNRRKLNEYSGEALSYQVLEQWAALGLGAAILPKSKLQAAERKAYPLKGKNGEALSLEFEAAWLKSEMQPGHLSHFTEFLTQHGTG